MVDLNLFGACGLYCGACNHYRASFSESKHLIDEAKDQGHEVEGFTCKGCRSGKPYIHEGCAKCFIRTCTEKRKISNCSECNEMPCEKLMSFKNDGHIHHLDINVNLFEIKRKGSEKWLLDQKERWTCKCGFPYSWYETTCKKCSEKVESYKK